MRSSKRRGKRAERREEREERREKREERDKHDQDERFKGRKHAHGTKPGERTSDSESKGGVDAGGSGVDGLMQSSKGQVRSAI